MRGFTTLCVQINGLSLCPSPTGIIPFPPSPVPITALSVWLKKQRENRRAKSQCASQKAFHLQSLTSVEDWSSGGGGLMPYCPILQTLPCLLFPIPFLVSAACLQHVPPAYCSLRVCVAMSKSRYFLLVCSVMDGFLMLLLSCI